MRDPLDSGSPPHEGGPTNRVDVVRKPATYGTPAGPRGMSRCLAVSRLCGKPGRAPERECSKPLDAAPSPRRPPTWPGAWTAPVQGPRVRRPRYVVGRRLRPRRHPLTTGSSIGSSTRFLTHLLHRAGPDDLEVVASHLPHTAGAYRTPSPPALEPRAPAAESP
ncbi:hypothetical protein Krad_2602 [Kineococcus radiotolerans SRS30216 = ATCC BAA-149]|uniref:Uncharacterized protein n=1 Tax=Kineococcus radiotolerans (strain ATCC BAA-149 / DSM 14245 / SRS30216) TaxID=266940 RepID=A6WB86_KINRD|nr:hypothetical protein Krad_2602 [Kineococcus radiotolerans SRS30216 = ATCC BAA-149]